MTSGRSPRLPMPAALAALNVLAALMLSACATRPPAPAPDFLLLGEVHDNEEQHRLRAKRLAELLADGRPTTVVFEQMAASNNGAIDAQRQRTPADTEALVEAGQLDRRAWRWPLHRPLFDAALAAGARVQGGNIERDSLRRVMREGEDAAHADVAALLRRTDWSDTQQSAMLKAIDDGHCGALPAAMHAPMVLAQRARDASLAQTMLSAQAAGAQRVVLIAGNGHVDRELGVPRYLTAAGIRPERILAVGYVEAGGADRGHYDERVETVPAAREDPCQALKR